MEVDGKISEAIAYAVKAGVFWRAARLNPKTRDVWAGLAAPHHEAAVRCLNDAMRGTDAGGVRPHSTSVDCPAPDHS